MKATACERRLGKVQAKIETLLACRPVGEFSRTGDYHSLLLLESALVKRAKCERAQLRS